MKKYFLFFLLATFTILSCQQKSSNREELPPPNILWITTEDIGPGLGSYGDDYAATPNLDQLAKEGAVYQKAYASAPICSPARSALITGVYATSLGTQHLRSDISIPEKIKTIPEYLRANGYFCTNNSKTDYNFDPSGRWDENSNQAHWRNRPEGKPFFSVFNFGTTHEGPTNSTDTSIFKTLENHHNPAEANLPPVLPSTEEFKKIWARQYDLITVMDKQAGDIINQLKEDGEYDNTI
ncbi:MAG: sulfatase-like hydrolase/transferase, partial [Cyclobacteriaceae bacterium]